MGARAALKHLPSIAVGAAKDADLARVSPLAHAHVIPSGTYHFGSEPSVSLISHWSSLSFSE